VDTANNRRDNLISYHDIISTERWEMGFLGFILGICEANAFSCYKVFADGGDKIIHSTFKDTMVFQFLRHCEELANTSAETDPYDPMILRSDNIHESVPLRKENYTKRIRLACKNCNLNGISRTRVEKRCSCNPDTPMCKKYYKSHLLEVGEKKGRSNHRL
jgi:hypothetical protein